MGLDIVSEDGKKDLWHSCYSTYDKFRNDIATACNLKIYLDKIYGDRAWKNLTEEEFQKLGDKKGAIILMRSHTGIILTQEECSDVLVFLTKYELKEWSDKLEEFKEGLKYCIDNNQTALYC